MTKRGQNRKLKVISTYVKKFFNFKRNALIDFETINKYLKVNTI